MDKKSKGAERVSRLASVFQCPLCGSAVKVVDRQSLVCAQNHTFDFARQGYLNLLTRPAHSPYTKPLFAARQQIIMESGLYAPVHDTITNIIREHTDVSTDPFLMLDLGCGEGSHLQKILDGLKSPDVTGVGLDISKEGILLAAKRYEGPIWLVADLAKSPLKDQSFHALLNILSPANYKEFKRVLVRGGLAVKVVPGPHYLRELRETLFADKAKKVYQNEEMVSLFAKHFRVMDVCKVSYTRMLDYDELEHLMRMTPLAWSADQKDRDAFVQRNAAEITVDLDILAGIHE